jgi:hypothetical protein
LNSNALDQDRLVKELRLAGIRTIEAANQFLLETYLPKMNGKFSRPASDPADAHVPLGNTDFTEILCFEHERVVRNDYVVRFECRLFQIPEYAASIFQKGKQDRADADEEYGGQKIYPQGQRAGNRPFPFTVFRAAFKRPAGTGGNGVTADRAAGGKPLGKKGFFPRKPAGRAPNRLKIPATPGTLFRPEGNFSAAVFAEEKRGSHRQKKFNRKNNAGRKNSIPFLLMPLVRFCGFFI